MNMNKALSTWKGLIAERNFSRIAILLLLLVTILALSGWASKDVRVVLVPPDLSEAVSISMSDADEGFKKAWGLFAAKMLGNVTPGSAPFMLDNLEAVFSPRVYQQLRNSLASQLERITRDRVAISFEPEETLYEKTTGKVFVRGRRHITGPTGDRLSERVTYEFEIEVQLGRPQISYYDQYLGQPKTQAHLQMSQGR